MKPSTKTTDPVAVVICHTAKAITPETEAKWRFAAANEIALPIQVFVDAAIISRSTTFRDRSLGLVNLVVVRGHASVTLQALAAYLLRLQQLAREQQERASTPAA